MHTPWFLYWEAQLRQGLWDGERTSFPGRGCDPSATSGLCRHPRPAEPALLTAATGPSGRSIPMPFLFIHFYFNKQPVPLAPAGLPPLRSPGLCENACAKRWRRGGAPGSPWHAPDVLCGQGAGTGGPERGPSLALQLPDLAAIQRDPAKCYFLNTLAFHNNLTTLLSFTSSLKRELDSFWLIYTDCIWKPSETEL